MKGLKLTGMALLCASAMAMAAPVWAQERVFRLDESAVGEIDPAKGTDYADTVLAVNLYEGLVYPKQGGSGVEPWLAKSWKVDGNTYTFALRDNATFSSGNPVTAEDVVFSYNRLMAMGQGSASLFQGHVKTVKAVDDKHVAFTLTGAYSPFLAATSHIWVVDSKVVKANEGTGKFGANGDYASDWLSAHSAGSGAYMVTAHDPQTETTMVRNPHYDGNPVDPHSPDKVIDRYSLETSTVRALIARGEHDMTSQWLPPEVFKAMAATGKVHLEIEGGGTGDYVKLNTARAPLDDVHCRRALMYAFDYGNTEKMLKITDTVSLGAPMKGPLTDGLMGADIDAPYFKQDMARAKKELSECKYDPAQYPLDIAWISEVPSRERIALLMQATFSQLGFKVNLVKTPWALVSDEVTKPATAPHAVEISAGPLTPDPDSVLYNMYYSGVAPTWMSAEHLKNDDVDKLLLQGRTETDPEKREAIYQELQSKLRDLAPDIFAYAANAVFAVRNGVELPDLSDPSKAYGVPSFSILFKDVQIND